MEAQFYNGLYAVSHEAHISFDRECMLISFDGDIVLLWNCANIIIVDRFHGIFSYSDTPDARLIVEDVATRDSIISRLPAKKQRKIEWSFASKCIAAMAAIVIMVFVIVPYLSPYFLKYIPKSWDTRLGNYTSNYYTKNFKECRSPEGVRQLELLVKQLTASIKTPYTYYVKVIKLPVVNAISLPGGYVTIYSDLIVKAQNADELAGVLAHEIGHSEKRHGMEMLLRGMSTTLLLDVFTGGGSTALYLATQLRDLSYSRDKEREADTYALDLLNKLNISSLGMAHFFKRMDEDTKLSPSEKYYSLISTHPLDQERFINAKRNYDHNKHYNRVMDNAQWQAVKEICTDVK